MSRSKLDRMNIRLVLSADFLPLESERCWRLALAIYELVTNAARHARFDGRIGEIKISLMRAGSWVNCRVTDNGSVVGRIKLGRGLRIVGDLIMSLGGRIVRTSGPTWNSFSLDFPLTRRELRANHASAARRPRSGRRMSPDAAALRALGGRAGDGHRRRTRTLDRKTTPGRKRSVSRRSQPQCSAPHSSRQMPRSLSSALFRVRHQPSLVPLRVSVPVARLRVWAPAVRGAPRPSVRTATPETVTPAMATAVVTGTGPMRRLRLMPMADPTPPLRRTAITGPHTGRTATTGACCAVVETDSNRLAPRSSTGAPVFGLTQPICPTAFWDLTTQ